MKVGTFQGGVDHRRIVSSSSVVTPNLALDVFDSGLRKMCVLCVVTCLFRLLLFCNVLHVCVFFVFDLRV